MTQSNVGVLLTNIGTPASPTTRNVRTYLRKFLSDPRVIEVPKFLWWPILNGIILPLRPKRSAKLYQQIWTEEGSPLLTYSQRLCAKLQAHLKIPVALGMHYSQPSISEGLKQLQTYGVHKILVLPLFPQYSSTTTASSFDGVAHTLKKWRVLPEIRTINHYTHESAYIKAVSHTIEEAWQTQGKPDHLVFSFHGIPAHYAAAGDPYPDLCRQTAEAIANKLVLPKNFWSLAFQSRLGARKWLTPYTDVLLKQLPKKGVNHVHVVCPGFATDCLETLEEIRLRGKEQFESAGGQQYYYIPALNDSDNHIQMFAEVILKRLQHW